MVWLYNSTRKSVFAVAVFHTTIDVTWQLFPIRGSYWDPRVNGAIIAIAAVVVVTVWGHELWLIQKWLSGSIAPHFASNAWPNGS